MALRTRTYGQSGAPVVVLHGGPGAPGTMAPVARGLADAFRVLEPWQRGSGGEPLTVAAHVADLHELMAARCPGARPALVGHSWGAMLALAYTAAHPRRVGSLVLIGCGTFDPASRARVQENRDRRMDEDRRRRMARLREAFPDPDRRLEATAALLLPVDSHAVAAGELELEACDARAYQETWGDMLRMQEEGVYPAAFAVIDAPVLMLHGAVDPHPGARIRASLEPYLPQLEYIEWERCGHYPWLERDVREAFFDTIRGWLQRRPG